LGTKFKCSHLVLRKVIKIVATSCHILRTKCTKFDFGWGSAPDPTGGALSVPPNLLAGFKGSYFYGKRREGNEKRGREGEKGIMGGGERGKGIREGMEEGRLSHGFGGMDAPVCICSRFRDNGPTNILGSRP